MDIGYFVSPHSRSILVVMDFDNWLRQIMDEGFPPEPALVRRATTPEVVAFEEHGDRFPGWIYRDFDELLDDEVKSGAPVPHLNDLLRITLRALDHQPEPQKTKAV